MPSAFPSPQLGGPPWKRCFQLPPVYPTVQGPVYADGGQDTFLSFTTPTRRWPIDYEVLSKEEGQVLDDHFAEALGLHLGFDFTDPDTGITHTNVKYEKLDPPVFEKEWIQARSIMLVKKP